MKTQRKAIAMIELIFALVIMGIVMMSAPMLISQSQKSTVVVLQQEAIAAGASDLNMILSRHWDEADTNVTLGAPVVIVTAGDAELNSPRAGTPASSNRNFFPGNEQNATTANRFGPLVSATLENDDANSSYDDIDDFASTNGSGTLVVADTALRGDLVDTAANTGSQGMVFSTNIDYVDDADAGFQSATIDYDIDDTAVAGTTNVKMITLTITTDSGIEELEKKIVFKAFSSNIGTYILESSTF